MQSGYKTLFFGAISSFCLIVLLVSPGILPAMENIDKVRADLAHKDWEVRLAAVEKLANRTDEQTIGLLMQVAGLKEEYWPVKIKAIELLGATANPKTTDLVLSTFNDTFQNWECPSIKTYAAIALGNYKNNPRVVDSLIEGIDDRELLTREASILSLGRIGDPKAVSPLLKALKDKSPTVRLASIKALEDINDPQAVPPIRTLAENDADPVVKERARAALNNFGSRQKN